MIGILVFPLTNRYLTTYFENLIEMMKRILDLGEIGVGQFVIRSSSVELEATDNYVYLVMANCFGHLAITLL